jgi:hypothetical protein
MLHAFEELKERAVQGAEIADQATREMTAG